MVSGLTRRTPHKVRSNYYYTNWEEVPVVLDVPAASIILGVHNDTVQKLLRLGKLSGKKVGKDWRIPKAAIMDYLGVQSNAQDKGGDEA